jgi:hypothetical protein
MGSVIGAAQQATALVRQQQRTVAQAQAGAQRYRLADLCLLPRQAIVQAAPGVAAQAIGEHSVVVEYQRPEERSAVGAMDFGKLRPPSVERNSAPCSPHRSTCWSRSRT